MGREAAISDKTKVPLSWIFILISTFGTLVVVGIPSVVWVSTIKSEAQAQTQLATQKAESADEKAKEAVELNAKVLDYLRVMDKRLSRIEGRLKISE